MPHSSPCPASLADAHPARVAAAPGSCRRTGCRRWSGVVSGGCAHTPRGDWGSGSLAFTMSVGSSRACRLTPSGSPAFAACSCPLGLSASGEPLTQERPLSPSRLRRGYDDASHGAHRTGQSPGIRLKPSRTPLSGTRCSDGARHIHLPVAGRVEQHEVRQPVGAAACFADHMMVVPSGEAGNQLAAAWQCASCRFQKASNCRRPWRVLSIATPGRRSKHSSSAGA